MEIITNRDIWQGRFFGSGGERFRERVRSGNGNGWGNGAGQGEYNGTGQGETYWMDYENGNNSFELE